MKNWILSWYRSSQIGKDNEEPALFNTSIRDNIAYGDNSRFVPMNEIILASKKSNCHNFISEFPESYEKIFKETQLTMDQQQRISIARSLIKYTNIFLNEEGISNLDIESEIISQEEDRIYIDITNSLSTLKKFISICVFKEGRIIEMGTHDELINLDGFYTKIHHKI